MEASSSPVLPVQSESSLTEINHPGHSSSKTSHVQKISRVSSNTFASENTGSTSSSSTELSKTSETDSDSDSSDSPEIAVAMGQQNQLRSIQKSLDDISPVNLTSINKQRNFDSQLQKKIKRLATTIKETPAYPLIRTVEEETSDLFRKILRRYICANYVRLSKYSFTSVVASESKICLWVLQKIRSSGILIRGFMPRISKLLFLFETQCKKKQKMTPWSRQTIACLTKFKALYDKRECIPNVLHEFIENFESNLKEKKINKIIEAFLTEEEGLQKEKEGFQKILRFLKRWNDPSSVDVFTSKVVDFLRDETLSRSKTTKRNAYLPKHTWIEPYRPGNSTNEKEPSINTSQIQEIARSFIPSGQEIFKKLTVNKRSITVESAKKWAFKYNVTVQTSSQSDPLNVQVAFFTYFLCKIYEKKEVRFSIEDIQNQALLIIITKEVLANIENISSSDINKDYFLSKIPVYKGYALGNLINWELMKKRIDLYENDLASFIVESCIPASPILRLCKNSNWLIAQNQVIKKLYQPFIYSGEEIVSPIHSTLAKDKGITCRIEIQNKKDFSVTQIKSYNVYKKFNQDPTSFHVEAKDKLATVEFRWSVSPYLNPETQAQTWKGVLQISKIHLEKNLSEELLALQALMMESLTTYKRLDPIQTSITSEPF